MTDCRGFRRARGTVHVGSAGVELCEGGVRVVVVFKDINESGRSIVAVVVPSTESATATTIAYALIAYR